MKRVTNVFIGGNRKRAREFVVFIRRKNMNSIYLTYLSAMIERE